MKKPKPAKVSIFEKIFGQLSWNSPAWITSLNSTRKERPRLFWGSLLITALILSFSVYGYYWYKNRPEPQWIQALITPPKISEITEAGLIYDNLIIDFGRMNQTFETKAVAPLQSVSKVVTEGITMTPSLPGEWRWDSDSRLIFIPKADWPAHQTFDIHFSKTFFSKGALINNYSYRFSTNPFELKITDFVLYQDPQNANSRKAIGTIDFNFPVDSQSLEKKINLKLQALKNNTDAKSKFTFTLSFDKFKRRAFVHSENLTLPQNPRFLTLMIDKGVQSAMGEGLTQTAASKNLLLPDKSAYFKLTEANVAIIRNDKDKPEQVLNIETSLGVTEREINKAVHLYLLPKDYPATATKDQQKDYAWTTPGEVTKTILAGSTPIKLEAIPAERHYSNLHSYRFKTPMNRFIYVIVDKGLSGFGNFTLTESYQNIFKSPEIPKEIRFLHPGSLLALSSEKKLSVIVRGIDTVNFEFARVLPENINQLITQSSGDFNNPYFINQQLNQQNISEIFREIRSFNVDDISQQQYTALDLSKYLSQSTNQMGPKGLFLLQATAWDKEKNEALDTKANRLILITDLGLLVKDNADKSHEIFVQSITTGQPLPLVNVSILGKNGLPLMTRVTDHQGHASFPDLSEYTEEQQPVVYLAGLGADVSFIPYTNFNRQLNYSRFDVGGLYSTAEELHQLSAYLFTDRGIYRPGEETHIGMIIKQSFAKTSPQGLPLQVSIVDPKGTTVYENRITVDQTGFLTTDFQTTTTSPTGPYTVNLSLIKDEEVQGLLGSTRFKVAEFQPDRMRIKALFSENPKQGWISPEGLQATVDLMNLYGSKAKDHKVSAKILLTPKAIHFEKFKEYFFVDPCLDPKKPPKVITEDLGELKTNEEGKATFPLHLEQFDKATYTLRFFTEGFEKDSGRSVSTEISALVSPLTYFVGLKKDGDFDFIKQSEGRSLNLIAINNELNPIEAKDLNIQIEALVPVSTLVKNTNGSYQYQSMVKASLVSETPFSIATNGSTFTLPTTQIGHFSLKVLDKENHVLASTPFTVVGESQKPLAKNAELTVKLSSESYKPGDDIEIQVTAPYVGTGLITIERDKVYAFQWFQTKTPTSLQKIHIPEDLQGDAYVNIAFIRSFDSDEIFINPLSYAVVPFSLNHEKSKVLIDLNLPTKAKPGEALCIHYKTDKPSKMILFGIDDGILQVARYQTPDPLAFFFQKHALEVSTQQIMDQILPKFIMEREVSSVGGDGGEDLIGAQLNPFKRKTDLPVVFWSGLIDANPEAKEYIYQIPEYFNGSLKVMAVAVSDNALGSLDKDVVIKGDFVINPNVPTFVSPGDEFEITASIANNLKNTTDNRIRVSLDLPDALEAISPREQTITIPPNEEKTAHFTLKAKSILGNATLKFKVTQGNRTIHREASLSLRAGSPMMTTILSGQSHEPSITMSIDRVLYPNYRDVTLNLSTNPLILALGLQMYLDNFPYGCTEQLVSKAFPLIAMGKAPQFTKDAGLIQEKFEKAIRILSERQMSSGAFRYWPSVQSPYSDDFATVYAMHFLTEARERGYAIPSGLFSYGIDYLKNIAVQNNTTLEKARVQAYAIYILTRNELVTSNYLTHLQLNLTNQKITWEDDLTGAYLAATYQLLQNQSEAERLIALFRRPKETTGEFYPDFYSPSIANAVYLYLIEKHFPQQLNKEGEALIAAMVELMNTHDLNTLLSSYISLALSAYPEKEAASLNLLVLKKQGAQDQIQKEKIDSNHAQLPLPDEVSAVELQNKDKENYFYQLLQSGFDKEKPDTVIKNGIEIYRDYLSTKGEPIQSVPLGEEIEVRIKVRTMDDRNLTNIAIVDLLPGGFELVQNSLKAQGTDYVDEREDRVIFYTSLSPTTTELSYRIKATNIGQYLVPPPYAESMYKKAIQARGLASVIVIGQTL